ncbi:DUF3048 domain-containing protein [Isoptericola sp. S6320L]|uniref:DUF3048 domain-containing protein n=1 Tax=Isoptericola sp. S6320L TaxID=2926411 RepID=UPI001FF36049|nr:DUF3048 domain-containing protein [Isoptericola sp. S6320L]MCK0118801.1 DUF3048 domain-containing protein [Isoptericola sp. S6320L]
MTLRRAASAVLAASLVLAAAGCAPGTDPQSAPRVTVAPDVSRAKIAPPAVVVPEPEPEPEPPRWPLTGVRTGTAKVPERPAVAVKIENSAASRPHTGLHRADVVWEQVVEGGISRFVAVYHSTYPRQVGPVRSVRPMDPATVAPLRGILAASGGQPPFLRAVERSGTQLLTNDDGDRGFWRSSSRAAPHNVYGNVKTFARQADRKRAEPPKAEFEHATKRRDATARAEGKKGRTADVRLSPAQRTTWTWAGGSYRRSDDGRASMSSGKRVTARNVLLLKVDVTSTGYRDPSGASVPKAELVDRGRGMLLGGGRAVPVTWSKKGTKAPLRLSLRGGGDVLLEPGNTWVELVPRGSGSWDVS